MSWQIFVSYFTAKVDLKEQETNLEDVKKRFEHCCVLFNVCPKPQENEVTPKDFFGLWTAFCDDFKTLYKREHDRIVKEKWVWFLLFNGFIRKWNLLLNLMEHYLEAFPKEKCPRKRLKWGEDCGLLIYRYLSSRVDALN